MKSVICYGDSNTYGYDPRNGLRYPKELRWTTILQKLLGAEYEVIVEGLNGRTTAYPRIDGEYKNGLPYLLPCLASHKPIDYIIFMLGTNDCNVDLNLSSKDISIGMEKLLDIATKEILSIQDYVPEIILVVPASIGSNYLYSPFADQLDELSVIKSKELASLYKELSNKYGCEYLDCSKLEVSSVDSEHLTIKSHQELARLLYEKIRS
ncbi:MAG: GDSL-type esterase/lipase family protein [Erysipelotrichaceae bacterium]|nr:GDSL-type esterase/lipase family protein [Erysipelotrichaceae bacterium]